MNKSIIIFCIMQSKCTIQPMEIPFDEMEFIQELQENASKSSSLSSTPESSLSSSPENVVSLSSSPEEEYAPAELASTVFSKAHFFCKMCRKKDGTLGKKVKQQPGANENLIEHLILVHRACLDCCVNYKMNVIFNTAQLAREHVVKEHQNPIPRPNPNDKRPLFEQMAEEIKEKKSSFQKKVTFEDEYMD